MLVVVSLLVLVFIFLYHHFTYYNNYWKERNVPGPEPTFFFGNIKDLALRARSTNEIFKEICDKYPNEKVVGIYRMRSPVLLVKDLEIIKHILIKDSDNFIDRDVDLMGKGLEANLFSLNGNTWRLLRHRFTPIFTSGKLKKMMYLITERGDRLIDYVDKIIKNQSNQEVHAIFKKYTQASIAACAFGLDMDAFNDEIDMFEKLETKILVSPYKSELEMIYPGILKRFKISFFPTEVQNFFRHLTKNVIAQRSGEPTERNDFMDLMLGLRKLKKIYLKRDADSVNAETAIEMTDDIIAGQVFIFYMAGYQTSALTMSFMLYHLALNPDIQEKVFAEIKDVLQIYEGKFSYEAVLDLKYLGQVFDETLRLHPVTDTLRRRADADYKLPGTELIVEKGQIFIIPIPVVHMDANIYANPKIFDPQRFSPENVALRHSCAYLPFGLGPRHCIGIRFAQLQSRVGVAKLLSAFRVEPSAETPRHFDYEARIITQPKGGFPLKLVRRL